MTATPSTTPSDANALETVLEYHRAWTSGDVDRALERVADDIVCHAPGEDLVSLADDQHVTLFYYPYTAATSTSPAAEYFTVHDGVIVENLLVFDRLSFGPPPEA